MLVRRLIVRFGASTTRHYSVSPLLLEAAGKADAKDGKTAGAAAVDPDDPQIAPTLVPWKEYKNEYFRKRGYTVAGPDWKEWSDLPEPFRYLGVKVNPDHVLNHGPVWKFMSDWRTAIPAIMCLSMPLWMFNVLPPVDERMELAFITLCAGWVTVSQVGPVMRSWKRSRVATKVKALLAHEKELNDEITDTMEALKAGSNIVDYVKAVHSGERALRKLEAEAATKRIAAAQRDSLVEQLNYLVQVQSSGAANTESVVVKAARSQVEAALEKDAALQQRTIEAAIKALKDGTVTEDVVGPLFTKAVEKARSDLASQPAAKPLFDKQQLEMFKKRFGFTEDTVSEGTLKRAQSHPALMAVLTGRVGGKVPAVGMSYTYKPALAYLKK